MTLVIIIIGAIVLTGMLYLDYTRKIDNSKKLQSVQGEIGPLEKEYTELSEKNSQMKKELEEKEIGTKSLMLTVDSMEQSVYDTENDRVRISRNLSIVRWTDPGRDRYDVLR